MRSEADSKILLGDCEAQPWPPLASGPLALLLAACASSPSGQRVTLSGGGAGIGFDDLRDSRRCTARS